MKTRTLDHALFVAAAHTLYGLQWQQPLSNHLGVSDRTLRRWGTGTGVIPPYVSRDLLKACEERKQELDALVKKLKQFEDSRVAAALKEAGQAALTEVVSAP